MRARGWDYVRARWYDPFLGRFISEDPIGLAGGINNYAYALNDPVNLYDPSGLGPCLQADHFRCGETILLPPVSSGTETCWVFSPCWFEQQASTELPPANYLREPRRTERDERSFLERTAEVASEVGDCVAEVAGLDDFVDLALIGAGQPIRNSKPSDSARRAARSVRL